MKIKIIDLLVKIANGEEVPKKIVIKDTVFNLDGFKYKENTGYSLGESFKLDEMLNDEVHIIDKVEIIEENPKKIEEITINENGTLGFPNGNWTARNMDKAFASKINELTERVNYLLEKSDEE